MMTNLIAESDSKIVYFCLRRFYCCWKYALAAVLVYFIWGLCKLSPALWGEISENLSLTYFDLTRELTLSFDLGSLVISRLVALQ